MALENHEYEFWYFVPHVGYVNGCWDPFWVHNATTHECKESKSVPTSCDTSEVAKGSVGIC